MIRIDTLEEMRGYLPEAVIAPTERALNDLADYLGGAPKDGVSFTELLGGPVFLIQTVADLADVRSFEEGTGGRLSVLETPSKWFDIAQWVGEGTFAWFMTVETAAGGPQYFIPCYVAEQVPNVAESIRLKLEEEETLSSQPPTRGDR